jgi:hypothetical protein
VKSVGKFAILLLTLSIFASPLMACLQPDSALTDEERECCRQMAGDCEGMPSSHSCCKTTVRDGDPYLNSSRFSISGHPQDALAVLPIIKMIDLSESNSQFLACSDAHDPPESPPSKTSILRI